MLFSCLTNNNKESYECVVCFNPFLLDQSPVRSDRILSTPCVNPYCQQSVCTDCIFKNIEHDINNNHCHEMKCVSCQTSYDSENVLEFLKGFSHEVADKYNTILFWKVLENNKGFVRCAHGCGSGVIADEHAQIVTCDKCHKKTCFVCKTKCHEGLTCDEMQDYGSSTIQRKSSDLYDIEQESDNPFLLDQNERRILEISQEKKALALIHQITKECPNCHLRFEKVEEDCDHVKCVCNFEFCWSCGADHKLILEKDNSYHRPTCRFHTRNINQ
ncbi:hypothetical protein FDP41_001472 [Naegleria fowleri]|uniref:RING-type domain-containing protein n=1 Tax=Naegleria fowleri TaxID=5763 RepID=A0A6A5BYT1_NAEFO|nr:uncharacterized protein FDP41_001472 [Naegleria fowleri]KAF0979494.1 hypothetical protein FDP41_001472 [Naegleria fowleri]